MKQSMSGRFRVGVDIGGTFTDIMLMDSAGAMFVKKISSTPDDYSRAIIVGLEEIFSEIGLKGSSIEHVIHGTTVATNAVLEHKGAKTGLITTKGFRDILEIRRFRMPVMYNLFWLKPPPLVDRYLRLEVDERISSKGEVLKPLDEGEVTAVIQKLVSYGVDSVAVCLINSYVNQVHEAKIGELLKARFPNLSFTLSSKLNPIIKEYERTSETVVNAYIMPITKRYLESLRGALNRVEVKAPLFIMQSHGGMMTAEAAVEKPVYMVESGPAAGVVGGAYFAKKMGIQNVITLDMGGTTTKASIIEGGKFSWSPEYEVGAGISVSSRLVKGGGYAVRVPSIDVAEIGAGGGSIIWVDSGGILHAGPRSAGAVPGPACYDRGGEEPTIADANVVLGYINPNYLAGGTLKLNRQKAYRAIEDKVAKPLRKGITEAAYGSYVVANASMIRAIRAVSTERGRDPRNFTTLAFGGAGPLHAAEIARALKQKRVIIPAYPGLFSAFGLLFAEMEYHHLGTFSHRLDKLVVSDLNEAFKRLGDEVVSSINGGKRVEKNIVVEKYVGLRYVGQAVELPIPAPWATIGQEHVPLLAESFNREHANTYGHAAPEEPIEIVCLRVVGKVILDRPSLPEHTASKGKGESRVSTSQSPQVRKAYFGREYGLLDTPVLKVQELSNVPREGPLIIEHYDATTVIPPGCKAGLGEWGTIVIDIGSQGG